MNLPSTSRKQIKSQFLSVLLQWVVFGVDCLLPHGKQVNFQGAPVLKDSECKILSLSALENDIVAVFRVHNNVQIASECEPSPQEDAWGKCVLQSFFTFHTLAVKVWIYQKMFPFHILLQSLHSKHNSCKLWHILCYMPCQGYYLCWTTDKSR